MKTKRLCFAGMSIAVMLVLAAGSANAQIVRSGDIVVDLSQVEKGEPLPVTPGTDLEILGNGGFETGAFPPWYHDGAWTITTNTPHSGAYCAYDIGNHWLRQDFAPTPASEIVSATLWIKQPEEAISNIYFHYSNLPTSSQLIWPTADWQQFNVTSFITPGGIVTGIQVWGYSGGPPDPDETFFDDISIQTAGAAEVEITLTPESDPIFLTQLGGDFDYTVEIVNLGTSPATVDAWTEAVFLYPDTVWFGPFINRSITIAAGATLTRDLTQYVPASAPDGIYLYYGRLGDYPATVYSEDFFEVRKGVWSGDGQEPVVGWELSGWDEDLSAAGITPTMFALNPPSPNPFNPEASLSYTVGEAGRASLKVYDISGRLVIILAEGYHPPGKYEVRWNGENAASGLYFFHLCSGGEVSVQKGILLK